ncbi:MAG: prepilin peptidase [Planctomycetaceae bacterium]
MDELSIVAFAILSAIDWSAFLREPIPELTRQPWLTAIVPLAVVGACAGWGIEAWTHRLMPVPTEKRNRARIVLCCATAIIWGLYGWMVIHAQSLQLDEVLPHRLWETGRLAFHLVFISLLIAATVTDLRDYVIPDEIVFPGIIIALCGAFISGDFQIIHFWVDWSYAEPGLSGPYIPLWEQQHPHWHGLAWSLAGGAIGAGIIYLIRSISQFVLQQESLGFGDVTLMAMIGCFLGWQPVVLTILIAPLYALAIGGLTRIVIGKTYVPYGPYLSLSALIVLMFWKWIWQAEILAEQPQAVPIVSLRRLFGDWVGILWLAGIGVGGMIILLVLLRIFRQLPVPGTKSTSHTTPVDSTTDESHS